MRCSLTLWHIQLIIDVQIIVFEILRTDDFTEYVQPQVFVSRLKRELSSSFDQRRTIVRIEILLRAIQPRFVPAGERLLSLDVVLASNPRLESESMRNPDGTDTLRCRECLFR